MYAIKANMDSMDMDRYGSLKKKTPDNLEYKPTSFRIGALRDLPENNLQE